MTQINDQSTVPAPFRADLSYLQAQDLGRLMACIVGIGGELFMLKAEVQRLRGALQACGALSEPALEAAGTSEAFKAWLDAEQQAFARLLLDPLAQPASPQERP